MKTNSCRTALFIGLLALILLLQPVILEAQVLQDNKSLTSPPALRLVSLTTDNYCRFLNEVAASNSDFLYDPKMGSDPIGACIIRLGTAGHFFYQVIEGRENMPIPYLTQQSAECYSVWAHVVLNSTMEDPYLRSNQRDFFVKEEPISLALTMMAPDLVDALDTKEMLVIAGTFLGALMIGGNRELGGEREPISTDHTHETTHEIAPPLTLDLLRSSVEAQPEVAGWHLDEQGNLHSTPTEEVTGHALLIDTLHGLLQERYSSTLAKQLLHHLESIVHEGDAVSAVPKISSAHLQGLFAKLDQIEQERHGIKSFFQGLIRVEHQKAEEQHNYQEADEKWKNLATAWKEQAHWDQKVKTIDRYYRMKEQLLEVAKEERAKIELEETTLGYVAAGFKKAAPLADRVASFLPVPAPVGTIVETLGKILEAANEHLVNRDLVQAERNFQLVEEERNRYTEHEETTRQEAQQQAKAAWKAEREERKAGEAAIQQLAEKLAPPPSSLDIPAWHSWANQLLEKGDAQNSVTTEHLVEHGLNDPTWMEKVITSTWQEGINALKKEEKRFKLEKLFPSLLADKDKGAIHLQAKEMAAKVQAAKDHSTALQGEVEKTMRVLSQAEHDYQKQKAALSSISTHRAQKEDNLSIYAQRVERAKYLLQKKEIELVEAEQAVSVLEEEAGPIIQDQSALKRKTDHAIERIQTALTAWKETGKKQFSQKSLPKLPLPKMSFEEEKGADLIPPPLIYDEAAERLARSLVQKQKERERNDNRPLLEHIKSDTETKEANEDAGKGAPLAQPTSLTLLDNGYYNVPDLETLGREDEERLKLVEKIERVIAARLAKTKEENDLSETGSITGTIKSKSSQSTSTFSKKEQAVLERETLASTDLEALQEEWKKLVIQRAKEWERAHHLEETLEESFDEERINWSAWQQLDQRSLEQRKEEKKEERATFLRAKMERESQRWEAYKKAIEAEDDLAQVKEAMKPQEERSLLAWQRVALGNKNIREGRKEELKEQLTTAQEAAQDAWQEWNTLAEKDPSVAVLEGADEASIKAAKEKLKTLDQAAIAVEKSLAFKEEVRKNQEARKKEQEDLYEPSEATVTKPSNIKRLVLQEYARQLAERKKEAQDLFYQKVDESEEKALAAYQQEVDAAALEGARSNSSVARIVWERFVEKSIQQSLQLQQNIEGPAGAHARMIAKADFKALQLFKEELRRVKFIKEKVTADKEVGERQLKRERDLAAQHYFEGEDRLWRALSPEERTAYNDGVQKANEEYEARKKLERQQLPEENLRLKEELLKEAEQKMRLAQEHFTKLSNETWSKPFLWRFRSLREKVLLELRAGLEQTVKIDEAQEALASAKAAREQAAKALEQAIEKNQKQHLQNQKINSYQDAANQAFIESGKMRFHGELPGHSDEVEELWYAAALAFQEAGVHFEKGIEVFKKGYFSLENLFCQTATLFQQAGKYYRETITALGSEEESKMVILYDKALTIQQKAENQRKLILLWEKNKTLEKMLVEPEKKITTSIASQQNRTAEAIKKGIEELSSSGVAIIYLEKASQAALQGLYKIETLWLDNVILKQSAADKYVKAAFVWQEGNPAKEKEATSWAQAASGASTAAVYLQKAIEAEVKDEVDGSSQKRAEAIAWRKVSELHQLRCENNTKAAEAWKLWQEGNLAKEKEAINWDEAGYGASTAAVYLQKTIKAEVKDEVGGSSQKGDEATAWRKVSELHHLRCENSIKAAEAWKLWQEGNLAKEKEATSWAQAANGACRAAVYLQKAIEAEVKNEVGGSSQKGDEAIDEAIAWRKVSELHRLRCENNTKAAEAWKLWQKDNLAKEKEATSWDKAAEGAVYAATYFKKAIETEMLEAPQKRAEAAAWIKASELQQLCCKNNIKAADALRLVNEDNPAHEKEAISWDQAAARAKMASEYLKKSIEAELKPEMVGTLQKPAEEKTREEFLELERLLCENYTKAAETYAKIAEASRLLKEDNPTNEKEATSWDQAAEGAIMAAAYLERAIEIETEVEADIDRRRKGKVFDPRQALIIYREENLRNLDDAALWKKASELQQLGCKNSTKAAETWKLMSQGNPAKEKEATNWYQAAFAARWASISLEESIKASKSHDEEEEAAYKERAKKYENSFYCWMKAAKAYETLHDDQAEEFEKKVITTLHEAEAPLFAYYLNQASRAEAAGKVEKSEKWRELHLLREQMLEKRLQVVTALQKGNWNEAQSCRRAASALYDEIREY